MVNILTDLYYDGEAIHSQFNDPVVDKLVEEYEMLNRTVNFYGIKSSESIYAKEETYKYIRNIDAIITKRFGMTFKHINSVNMYYACMPISPDIDSVINANKRATDKLIKDNIEACSNDTSCVYQKDVSNIRSLDRDELSVMHKYLTDTEVLHEKMNTKGIVFDLKNAKIIGVPPSIVFFLMSDLAIMLRKSTARQLVAILMHEIGHVYTHMYYVHRSYIDTTIMRETFLRSYSSTGNLVDSMKIAGRKTYGKEIAGNSSITVFMDLSRETVSRSSPNNILSFTDSEHLADSFSTRFGLGGELSAGLYELMSNRPIINPYVVALGTSIYMSIYVLAYTLSIALAGVAVVVMAIYFFFNDIMPVLMRLMLGNTDSSETVYDDPYNRMKRIRLELVRMVRLDQNVRGKANIDAVISMLDTIDMFLVKYRDSTVLSGAIGNLMPWNKEGYLDTREQRLIEQWSENELHVYRLKLDKLKRDKNDSK